LTMLYRSTDRLCRCGAPVQYLSHSASFHFFLMEDIPKPSTSNDPCVTVIRFLADCTGVKHNKK
jgi:hypothetical protein